MCARMCECVRVRTRACAHTRVCARVRLYLRACEGGGFRSDGIELDIYCLPMSPNTQIHMHRFRVMAQAEVKSLTLTVTA